MIFSPSLVCAPPPAPLGLPRHVVGSSRTQSLRSPGPNQQLVLPPARCTSKSAPMAAALGRSGVGKGMAQRHNAPPSGRPRAAGRACTLLPTGRTRNTRRLVDLRYSRTVLSMDCRPPVRDWNSPEGRPDRELTSTRGRARQDHLPGSLKAQSRSGAKPTSSQRVVQHPAGTIQLYRTVPVPRFFHSSIHQHRGLAPGTV